MNKKYIKGKYNPFEINKIFFDNRTGFIKMIPENFQKSTLFWLIVMTLYFALKYTIKALIRYKKTSFRDLYDNTLLFVLPTLNNQRALQKVIDVVKPVKNNVRIATKDFYSNLYVAFTSLFYIPYLWKDFQKQFLV